MNWKSLLLAVAMVVSVAGAPVAAVATSDTAQDRSKQTIGGTYVSFAATENAVVNYTVNGNTLVERMNVQNTSTAGGDSGGALGVEDIGLFTGAGVSVSNAFGAGVSTRAVLQADSGAEIVVHDNDRGIAVIKDNAGGHVARFSGASGVEAEKVSRQRAVIRREGGARAAVIVVGPGNVSVSGGNVTAMTAGDGHIVYRQYDGERSDSEKQQERLIANGTAVAEVYYQFSGDSGDEGKQRLADVVRYSENATVEATTRSKDTLNMTLRSQQPEGKVVVVAVNERAFELAEQVQVYVDGQAATRVDSYSALRAAIDGGESSKYLTRPSTSARASTDVVVAINHFSAREVSVQSSETGDGGTATAGGGDGGAGGDGDAGGGGDTTESGGQPGFGVGVAVLALVGAALLARQQR